MRILIAMPNLRSGGGLTMGLGLIKGLAELNATGHEFFITHPTECGYEPLFERPLLHSIPVDQRKRHIFHKLRVDQVDVPKLVKKHNIDVLLSFNNLGTWRPGCTHVVYVHMAHFAYRVNEFDFPKPPIFFARQFAQTLYFQLQLHNTNMYVVQTALMKRRLCKRWSLPDSQVEVIAPGVDESSSQQNVTVTMPAALMTRQPQRALLSYVASPMRHKNFEILPATIAQLVADGFDCDIVLTVSADNPMLRPVLAEAHRLGCADRFVCIGPVPRAIALAILQRSFCTVIPTLLETVGLPYTEAMSCRCPIVTSDRDFSRGVVGDAAIFFDPHNPRSIADAVLSLRDTTRRNALIDAGAQQLQLGQSATRWVDMAAAFVQLLESVK